MLRTGRRFRNDTGCPAWAAARPAFGEGVFGEGRQGACRGCAFGGRGRGATEGATGRVWRLRSARSADAGMTGGLCYGDEDAMRGCGGGEFAAGVVGCWWFGWLRVPHGEGCGGGDDGVRLLAAGTAEEFGREAAVAGARRAGGCRCGGCLRPGPSKAAPAGGGCHHGRSAVGGRRAAEISGASRRRSLPAGLVTPRKSREAVAVTTLPSRRVWIQVRRPAIRVGGAPVSAITA